MTAPYYQDEHVTLYHGDCLEVTEWLAAVVLVTDPPYGVDWDGYPNANQYKIAQPKIAGDKTAEARDAVLALWGSPRPALVFGSWRVARPAAVRARPIWHKANKNAMRVAKDLPWYPTDEEIYALGSFPDGLAIPNVIVTHERRDGAAGESARIGHPTPKPVGLIERLLAACPTGSVADPFTGSGSTLLAARNQGRRAIGVEIEERYCEIAARRLAQGVLDFGDAS